MVQPLGRTVRWFLNKLKIELPHDPAISLLGYIQRNQNSNGCMHLMFTAALFTTAKTWKQPKCPSTEEWIKMWYVSIQWNISQS